MTPAQAKNLVTKLQELRPKLDNLEAEIETIEGELHGFQRACQHRHRSFMYELDYGGSLACCQDCHATVRVLNGTIKEVRIT